MRKETRKKIEKCFQDIEKGLKEGDEENCKKCPLRKECEEYARGGEENGERKRLAT